MNFARQSLEKCDRRTDRRRNRDGKEIHERVDYDAENLFDFVPDFDDFVSCVLVGRDEGNDSRHDRRDNGHENTNRIRIHGGIHEPLRDCRALVGELERLDCIDDAGNHRGDIPGEHTRANTGNNRQNRRTVIDHKTDEFADFLNDVRKNLFDLRRVRLNVFDCIFDDRL